MIPPARSCKEAERVWRVFLCRDQRKEGSVDLGVFVRGLVVGLAVAAPVGPIGVLCIRRTLADGRLAGLATGLGAATVDAFYGGIAGFGVTVVSGLLPSPRV